MRIDYFKMHRYVRLQVWGTIFKLNTYNSLAIVTCQWLSLRKPMLADFSSSGRRFICPCFIWVKSLDSLCFSDPHQVELLLFRVEYDGFLEVFLRVRTRMVSLACTSCTWMDSLNRPQESSSFQRKKGNQLSRRSTTAFDKVPHELEFWGSDVKLEALESEQTVSSSLSLSPFF